jgi:hypothetical protein
MLEPATDVSVDRSPRDAPMSRTSLEVSALAGAIILGALYVGWFATLRSYPFEDFPNHLARGVAMSDLLFNHGQQYGHVFTFSLVLVPYLLHDLLLATLIGSFGVAAGGSVFVSIVLLSMPLALMFYMRAANLALRARPIIFIIGLYLATDCFFLLGFMGFRLALALILVTLGLVEMLRRKWSTAVFMVYVATLVVGYLTHLTATVFFAALLAASSAARVVLFRTTTLRRETALWAPLAILMILHVTVLTPGHSATNPATYGYFWGTWQKKLQYLNFEYMRFGSHLEPVMMLLLLACLIWPLRRQLQLIRLLQPGVLEPLLIAVAFGATYLLMPQYYSDSAYVDVRALPIILLMFMFACLNWQGAHDSGSVFFNKVTLLSVLALGVSNFAFLVRHVGKHEIAMNQYRELADRVPARSSLLPVHTLRKDGELRPLLHASGYAAIDRAAVVPYLFSGDHGDPMKYFRYRDAPYRPEDHWYQTVLSWNRAQEQTFVVGGHAYTWRFERSGTSETWKAADLAPVDWNRVACTYDYLIVTLPVEMKLIELSARPIGRNDTAELFAVDRSTCRRDLLARPQGIKVIVQH